MSFVVGDVVEGTVTGITNFGAFVELPGGVTGLVHISEVADSYVKDVNDHLEQKQKIKVKVIKIDPEGKIALSIRQLQAPKGSGGRSRRRQSGASFEDKLAKFLKESDEKQQILKRKSERRTRGGTGNARRSF
ncbi:MAG: S1 RNA-binding domain-containing protein [Clostridia bacterium]|nr:S1 RNA-binding domain-containing protein [Clostridia bacterium]